MLVKHNGDGAADVVAGDGSPFLRSAVVHLHVDHVTLHVVIFRRSRCDGITFKHSITL